MMTWLRRKSDELLCRNSLAEICKGSQARLVRLPTATANSTSTFNEMSNAVTEWVNAPLVIETTHIVRDYFKNSSVDVWYKGKSRRHKLSSKACSYGLSIRMIITSGMTGLHTVANIKKVWKDKELQVLLVQASPTDRVYLRKRCTFSALQLF